MNKRELSKYRVQTIEEINLILRKHDNFNVAMKDVKIILSDREKWRITKAKYFFNIQEIIGLYKIWLHVHGFHGVV